jgi:hypothetical protein
LISLAAIDSDVLPEALATVRAIEDEYDRAEVLISFVEHAPQDLLATIWDEIDRITNNYSKAGAIGNHISRLPLHELSYPDWCKYLHLLAHRDRAELMANIAKLYPVLLRFGGETTLRGVVDAINEVYSQWK